MNLAQRCRVCAGPAATNVAAVARHNSADIGPAVPKETIVA